jgi:hypothetical protein
MEIFYLSQYQTELRPLHCENTNRLATPLSSLMSINHHLNLSIYSCVNHPTCPYTEHVRFTASMRLVSKLNPLPLTRLNTLLLMRINTIARFANLFPQEHPICLHYRVHTPHHANANRFLPIPYHHRIVTYSRKTNPPCVHFTVQMQMAQPSQHSHR